METVEVDLAFSSETENLRYFIGAGKFCVSKLTVLKVPGAVLLYNGRKC